ncbi:MAG: MFS transporter [Spirochaetia bacterium]|nr:MFS transporter [Spirochaetia bacterium]
MLNTLRRIGLVISLAGFSLSINTLPALVTWFSFYFEFPIASFGIIFSLQYVAFTFSSIIIGRLHSSRHLPLYGIVLGSLLASSICLFFIGILPSFPFLVMTMLIIGGAGGLVESIGTTLLTSSNGTNRMLYTSQFFYALGAFIAPMLVGLLLSLNVSIPMIGHLIGLFSLALGTLVWLLVYQPWKSFMAVSHESNRDYRVKFSKNDEKFTHNKDFVSSKIDLDENIHSSNGLSSYAFLLLSFTMLAYVFIESTIGNWFAVYVEESLTFTPADASFTLSLYWTGLGVSRLTSMIWMRKNHSKSLLIYMGIMLIAILLLFFPIIQQGRGLLFITIFILGFGCGPIWPLLIEYCSRIFVQEHLLMYLIGAGSVGALLGPIVTSTLFSIIGLNRMHILICAYVVIMLFAAMFSVGIIARRPKNVV